MSSSALPFFLFFFFFFLHLLLLPPCCVCCSRHLLLHAGAGANSSSSLADMLQVTHGGANGSVTDGLRRYLARFGYASSAPDDADGRVVVSLYQSTLGLPVTGRLDAPTLDLLATPRCGVPDLQHSSQANATATATARFAFFDGQPRWARAPGHFLLTYAVLSTPPYQPLPLPRKAVRGAFRAAFARWARVIPVRFRETRDYNTADVRVGFLAGDHGDGEPFDGPLGVLGHAFSPPSGQLHLDAAERWAVLGHDDDGVNSSAVDLESVATHEIGHVLGLAHSSVPDAVMYPSMKPRTRKAELTLDDVRGVQALYGSNPQFSLSSLSEPDTSSSAPAVATTRSPGKTTATHTAILLLLVTVTPLLLLC